MTESKYKDEEAFFKRFGARVKELRLKKGWTQEDMISQGIGYRFYQRIESGKPLHFKTALKIADVFEMSLEKLLKGL